MRYPPFGLGMFTHVDGRPLIAAVVLAAAAVAGLAHVGAGQGRAQTPAHDPGAAARAHLAGHPEEARRFVKDYLARNPQVLQEVLVELMTPRTPSPRDTAASIKNNAAALFYSANRVPLGNPNGDVTLVEFVDYNCGFCKRAFADLLEVMKADARLKVVVIEHPVLGGASTEAARIATALQMHDHSAGTYAEFHRRLLAGPAPASKVRALAVAAELGLDVARLEALSASSEVDAALDESRRLARALGVRGTPSYVIGDRVLFGAVGLGALQERIAAARQQ